MPTLKTPGAPQEKEFFPIDDLSDQEIVDLLEGISMIDGLSDLKIVETFDGNYDSAYGQERIVIFQRPIDGKLFRYIYNVNNSDNYEFVNVPQLEEVSVRQETINIYE